MRRSVPVLLLVTLLVATVTVNVYADVPNTLSITRRTEGVNTIIDVRVRHGDPTSSHYISQINVDLDGTVRAFTNLPKATATEATYTLNLGSGSVKVVKAQAVCNLHGAGAYYSEAGTDGSTDSSGIPAYPLEAMITGALIGAVIIIAMRKP